MTENTRSSQDFGKCRGMSEKNQLLTLRISNLAKEKGLALSALSLRAGLGKGVVADIVQNPDRRPRELTIQKIAKALGVDVRYLTGKIDKKHIVSVISTGPKWSKDNDSDLAPIAQCIDSAVDADDNGLRSFHLDKGAIALGIAAGSTVIVDTQSEMKTGDLVLTQDPETGFSIRYIAEPYLVSISQYGHPEHTLRSPNTSLIGKVRLTMQVW